MAADLMTEKSIHSLLAVIQSTFE